MRGLFVFSEATKAGGVRKRVPHGLCRSQAITCYCTELQKFEMKRKKKKKSQPRRKSAVFHGQFEYSLCLWSICYLPGTGVGIWDATLDGPDIVLPSRCFWHVAMEGRRAGSPRGREHVGRMRVVIQPTICSLTKRIAHIHCGVLSPSRALSPSALQTTPLDS